MDSVKFKLRFQSNDTNSDQTIDLDKVYLEDESGDTMTIEELLNALSIGLNQIDDLKLKIDVLERKLKV